MPKKETIRNLFDVDGNMKDALERYKETLALSGGLRDKKMIVVVWEGGCVYSHGRPLPRLGPGRC